MGYSNGMDDIYKTIEEDSPNRKRKIWMVLMVGCWYA